MKKLLSFVLVVTMLMTLILPARAANIEGTTKTVTDDMVVYDNAEAVLVMAWDSTDTVVIAAVDKNEPSTVYQWIGTLDDAPINATVRATTMPLSVREVACFEGVETFTETGESFVLTDTTEERQEIEEEVVDAMIRKYGAPQTAWPVSVDRTTYAPLTISIRETDIVEGVYNYQAEIEYGMTIAAAAAKIAVKASLGVLTVRDVLYQICKVSVATYTFVHDGYVDTYTGNYISQRTSFVSPETGDETPVHTATKVVKHCCMIATIDEGTTYEVDVLTVSGTADILYAPSEYEYQIDMMIDDAYDIYMN